jgi:hypothetical protein
MIKFTLVAVYMISEGVLHPFHIHLHKRPSIIFATFGHKLYISWRREKEVYPEILYLICNLLAESK